MFSVWTTRSTRSRLARDRGGHWFGMEKEKCMQIPLQISFPNMDPSPAIEAVVREKAAKLDRFFERIVSCDVTIEAPHRHRHAGQRRACESRRLEEPGA